MTTPSVRRQLEQCLEQLERGALTPQRLRQVIDQLPNGSPGGSQDLLFLNAKGTALDSELLGFTHYRAGRPVAMPDQLDPDGAVTDDGRAWPYRSVTEAIEDGWRLIGFPNAALMMDDSTTYGLGFEFVLEKWSDG
ncbi:MAG: hypothetical protein CMJ18_10385 [Phycisphaeraceae bacterium]|nr:hypothetical protein [Phycisphaeraceae bacterium]